MRQIPRLVLLTLGALSVAAAWAAPLPNVAPAPDDNPMTDAKVTLGKQLFFDPRLSSTGAVSCNSCHNVMANGTDNRAVSVGVHGQVGGRSAPTVWNSGFKPAQFWDGRAPTLEEQAKGPLLNPIEMGMPGPDAVVAVVAEMPGYVSQFEDVFGSDGLNFDNIARAIAAYERTLVTPDSPYDRYQAGDESALSPAALRGLNAFTSVGCAACHSGPVFAGPTPVGIAFRQKFPANPGDPVVVEYDLLKDPGFFQQTSEESDKQLFQVPQLRNVALTAPYMSQGSVPTLDEAIVVMGRTQLGRELTQAEVSDLVAFLDSLTGRFPEQSLPRLPESPGRTVVRTPGAG